MAKATVKDATKATQKATFPDKTKVRVRYVQSGGSNLSGASQDIPIS